MEGASAKLLTLLSFGLILLFCYVNANVPLYGDNMVYDADEDMSIRLKELKDKEAYLEREMATRTSREDKLRFYFDLRNVRNDIEEMEESIQVSYQDYLRLMSEQRQQFERETAQLRQRLVEAENRRIQAIDSLTLQKQGNGDKIGHYKQEVDKLTEQRNTLAREYAEFTNAYHVQEQTMKQQRDHFYLEQGKLQDTLDEAKKKHAQALAAMTVTPTQSYRPIRIPEQDEINKLRSDITKFNGIKDRKLLKGGLESTRTKLKVLLDKLYKEGKFSPKTSREDLKNVLSEIEEEILRKREEQDKRRNELLENMKQKDLNDYDDKEITALQKINEEVAGLDVFQKETACRKAYLIGILEVSNLLQECSDAIRDANERNLANMWADTVQEARDSPLAKMWADAVKEAKDSDFAKAWADAIQNANTNIAKAWTEAIRDIKDSPVAKMWGDAIKNAKASSFGKFCKNALADAKNTLCNVNLIQ